MANTRREDNIVNIYIPNIGASKYVKQILMNVKGEIHSNTVIGRYFNIQLTLMDRYSKWKINKKIMTLNVTLNQIA